LGLVEFDRWLDAQLGQRDPGEQALLREVLDGIPQPQLHPVYDAIIAEDSGSIWVGEYAGQLGLMGLSPEVRRVPARRWLVFGSDGILAATVGTPEGFVGHAVREGRVWGVFRDELGVESVRGYRIAKR
jgi:hypothetical protein